MSQFLYDDKYVNTASVISSAKLCSLDMQEVFKRMKESGYDQDKLWEWSKWVYSEIKKENPNFVDWRSLRFRLIGLGDWNNVLEDGLKKALESGNFLKWEKEANNALEIVKAKMRKLYG